MKCGVRLLRGRNAFSEVARSSVPPGPSFACVNHAQAARVLQA